MASKKLETTALSPLRSRGAPVEPKVRAIARVHSETTGIAMEWYPLGGGKTLIGREPGVGRIAFDDLEASRKHAEVEYVLDSDVYRIRDLDSRNHTFVDGKEIESEYLHPGAVIRVGGTLLVYAEVPLGSGLSDFEPEDGVALWRSRAERLIDLTASSKLPVLIHGPTGAGKELLAQRVHEKSGRSGDFVSINCGTFSRDLLASELFGHTQGAFSGAATARAGLFVAADHGTLFLDEIAELPLDQQPALLRALQEGRVRPVGSDREVGVEVRVVGATHRDLEAEVEANRFRADLRGRLSGMVIELPGLADRREEILSLYARLCAEGDAPRLTSAAAELLLLYDWPLNVRELKHFAERARIFAGAQGVIRPEDLPSEIRAAASQEAAEDDAPSKNQLERLLAEHEGNVAQVARALGKHRQQLYRWLKRHGLEPTSFRKDPS